MSSKKTRLSLKDFYYADKHAQGKPMPIMLPSGDDSGETLQIIGPASDAAVKASRAYSAAVRQVTESLKDVEQRCKDSDDFTEWNELYTPQVESLNRELAASLIIGWSMDDEFTEAAVLELLRQYKGLIKQVIDFFSESNELYLAK